MLPSDLVNEYINGFWGYGRLSGPVWIVGMEEGGATIEDEVREKLQAWESRGRPPVQDLLAVHQAPPLNRWFVGNRPLQPTWRMLIRFLIAAAGHDDPNDRDLVRRFQCEQLGRPSSDHCILELLPLPAPNVGSWPYDRWTDLPTLRSREAYQGVVRPRRIALLRSMIAAHRPALVLFYGCHEEQRAHWEAVSGIQLAEEEACQRRIWIGQRDGTVFGVVPHPTSRGVSKALFIEMGRRMAAAIS